MVNNWDVEQSLLFNVRKGGGTISLDGVAFLTICFVKKLLKV